MAPSKLTNTTTTTTLLRGLLINPLFTAFLSFSSVAAATTFRSGIPRKGIQAANRVRTNTNASHVTPYNNTHASAWRCSGVLGPRQASSQFSIVGTSTTNTITVPFTRAPATTRTTTTPIITAVHKKLSSTFTTNTNKLGTNVTTTASSIEPRIQANHHENSTICNVTAGTTNKQNNTMQAPLPAQENMGDQYHIGEDVSIMITPQDQDKAANPASQAGTEFESGSGYKHPINADDNEVDEVMDPASPTKHKDYHDTDNHILPNIPIPPDYDDEQDHDRLPVPRLVGRGWTFWL